MEKLEYGVLRIAKITLTLIEQNSIVDNNNVFCKRSGSQTITLNSFKLFQYRPGLPCASAAKTDIPTTT